MTPNLKLASGANFEEINRLYVTIKDVIPRLSPEMRNTMEQIYLFSDSKAVPCKGAYGCALGKIMYLSKSKFDLTGNSKISKNTIKRASLVFAHELTHMLTDKINRQQGNRVLDKKTKEWGSD